MQNLTQSQSLPSIPTAQSRHFWRLGRFGVALGLATAITFSNWLVQSRLTSAAQNRQKQLIAKVQAGTTVDSHDLKDITKLAQVQGGKVTVTGELQPGRFVVKRNRGEEEGYIVLAPFIIDRQKFNTRSNFTANTKYMLNLGWVPKDSKHKIREAAAIDVLKFDDLPEELASDEDALPKSTITAFVRRGEERDILRGRNNWAESELFKYIDLGLLQGMFHANNRSFTHVYLDRTEDNQQEESFPFPNTTENYIKQLNEEAEYAQKRGNRNSWGVGLLSFTSAALFGLL